MNKYAFILANFGISTLKTAFYGKFDGGNPNSDKLTSYLGGYVFSDVILRSQDYSEDTLEIYIDTVLIDVKQTKNIVKTIVQGRPGTVKEYISDGDYFVALRGMIVNNGKPEEYPIQDVIKLRQLLEKPAPIDVISDYINMFGIHHIVVEDYTFPQREGFQNTQTFEILASSDLPISMVLEIEK